MKRVVFRSVARAETEAAFRWYEDHERGLGRRFMISLQKTIDSIQAFPKMYQRIRGEIRQALLKQFPFSVLYIEEDTRVVVLAIFHQSRDPEVLEERI